MASYPQYRAPSANNAALVDPTWHQQFEQLRDPPRPPAVTIGGVPLPELAAAARRELVSLALDHTGAYANADGAAIGKIAAGVPLVVSGHQPELVHPGVWFKNFALDELAKRVGGVGVYLLIDSDLCRGVAVQAPTGPLAAPRAVPIAYDRPDVAVPHEERPVFDLRAFGSFAARAADAVQPLLGERPIAERLWRPSAAVLARTVRLGLAISELRHRVEREWGSQTLEVPIGAVCDGESFRRLAAELLVRADGVASAYNGALAEYRAAHRLRSAAQPLPDLAADGEWCEAPIWTWSTAEPVRRAVFVRRSGGSLTLTDRAGWTADGPTHPDGVVAWLGSLRAAGRKVRSRALVTTLFARLCLGDLFLHGIGGAKYDQVTDRFCERLFGAPPPRHATLSATLRLPIEYAGGGSADGTRGAARLLRDLRWRPERFAPTHPAAAVKRAWVATEKTPANAAQRHVAIRRANDEIAATLGRERAAAEAALVAAGDAARVREVLGSRERSFCLFPEEDLRRRLAGLLPAPLA